VNRNLLVFLLLVLILVNLASGLSSDKTYVFKILKNGLYISPESLTLFDSPFSERSNSNEGEYIARLTDKDKTLYSVRFDFKSLIFFSPSEECLDENNRVICNMSIVQEGGTNSVILNFPYFKEANAIDVYHNDEFLFRFDFVNETGNIFMTYWYYFVAGAVVLLILITVILIKRKHSASVRQMPIGRFQPMVRR